jgi:LysM domain
MAITIESPVRSRIISRLMSSIASVICAIGLVAGVPWMLWRYVGWPFPARLPTMAQAKLAIELRDFSDRLLIGTLAVVVWICWAMTMVSLFVHVVGRIRNVSLHCPVLIPAALHRLIGKWIGSAALLVAMIGRPASAAAPQTISTLTIETPQSSAGAKPDKPSPTIPTGPPNASTGRTYKVGSRESLWSIAEATLGDGTRWNELLAANKDVITDPDMLPAGMTLTIPDGKEPKQATKLVEVERGDNMWSISRETLEASGDPHVTNAEVVPLWRDVIHLNEHRIKSGNPNLIYPGEELVVPDIAAAVDVEPVALGDVAEPTTPPVPTTIPAEPAATIRATIAPVLASPVPALATTEPVAVDDGALSPKMIGLALSGVAAAAILAAMARNRRRAMRAHTVGASVPVVTSAARTLISELRGIAEPKRIESVEQTLRYLFVKSAEANLLPTVTIIRVGDNGVELLATDANARCPKGFTLLDDATLVVDPALDLDAIGEELLDSLPLCPALVTVGTSATGDVLIDLEQIGALTIEADSDERAFAVMAAIAMEQVGLPWASENTLYGIGLPAWMIEPCGIELVDNVEAMAERYLRYAEEELSTTHVARLEGLELFPPAIVFVAPSHEDAAQRLSDVAIKHGSGLAVVTASPQSATTWRLVVTKNQGELEPVGLNLFTVRLHAVEVDANMTAQLDEIVHPVAAVVGNQLLAESVSARTDGLDDVPVEGKTDGRGAPSSSELLRPVDEVIAEIMEPKPIELFLLGSAPRLEGVERNGKPASRADEIVAFIALHGPACPRELGEALWPGKRNMSQQVTQATSRARTILGVFDVDHPRLSAARRNAPYELHDVGCDWHRFRLLVAESNRRELPEAATLLKAALALVTGTPFGQRRERSFEWAADCGYQMEIALAVADASERLGEITLQGEDPEATLLATSQGMLAIPDHEGLIRLRLRAHSAKGDPHAARLEYRAACERLEGEESLLADLDDSTRALFEALFQSS